MSTYKGVYSTQDIARGASARGRAAAKRYWMAWDEGDTVRVQPLSSTFEPIGAGRSIAHVEFSARFSSEPGLAVPDPSAKAAPAAQAVGQQKAKPGAGQKATPVPSGAVSAPSWVNLDQESTFGKKPKAAPEQPASTAKTPRLELVFPEEEERVPFSGTPTPPEKPEEPKLSVKDIEHAMRAEFATALARLRIGQKERAITQIDDLLSRERPHEPSFRHMFTEFGINLRKSKLPDMALRSHMEARSLSPEDSHILFNAARATYDLGNIEKTRDFLKLALALSPDLEPARRFLDFLDRKRAH